MVFHGGKGLGEKGAVEGIPDGGDRVAGPNLIAINFDNIFGVDNVGRHISRLGESDVFAGAEDLKHLDSLADGP